MVIDQTISVPVLLIGFNRPETISKVYQRIREVKPLKLYIAIDGPRDNKNGEKELVEEVKRIVTQVDWECDVYYRFNSTNRGAEITVSSAISWVLEKEEYVIVLEDDILASPAFFSFAQEMLIRYKDEEKIWRVTGTNYFPELTKTLDSDYFFAKWGISWGWATWKRVWEKYDLNIEIKKEHLSSSFLSQITYDKSENYYFRKFFTKMRNNGIGNNTWDYIALYLRRVNGGIDIIPKVNLISNIGEFGLHAKGKSIHHFREVSYDFEWNRYPQGITCNTEYDKLFFKKFRKLPNHYFLKEIVKNIYNKLKK